MGEGRGRKKTHSPSRLCTNPLPVKHPITIQDGGIENLIYLASHSKITLALQATKVFEKAVETPQSGPYARVSKNREKHENCFLFLKVARLDFTHGRFSRNLEVFFLSCLLYL